MAKRSDILAGAVDQTVDVWIQDSTSTTGAGKTGLVYNTSGLVCYYRKGATGTATALTLATQTVGGAHSDGGFVEIDATNMPGLYRLDLSDTIVAASGMVTVLLKGATGMAPVALELEVQPSTGKVANTTHLAGTAYASADFSSTMKASINTEVVDGLTVDVVADSIPSDGSRPTIAQACYMLTQFLLERAVSGTTVTVKKPDGSTTLMTLTLDSGTAPTSITRST